LVALSGWLGWFIGRGQPESPLAVRFTLPLVPQTQLTPSVQPIAISRDGRVVVYNGASGTASRLYVRHLDRLDWQTPVDGANPDSFILSPDSQWVAFNDPTDSAIKKVRITGGPIAVVCKGCSRPASWRGATWAPQGVIVFSTAATPGLMSVSDTGGVPSVLTEPDAGAHVRPHFLPDGKVLLFVIRRSPERDRIAAFSFETRKWNVLLEGSFPHYVTSGHIVFLRDGVIWAATFDAQKLQVTGDAVRVLQGVGLNNVADAALMSISDTGTLIYTPGTADAIDRTLLWVDRAGREEAIPAPPKMYGNVRLSPDGSRLAIDVAEQNRRDLWIWHFQNQRLSAFHTSEGINVSPVWTRDGRRIAFASEQNGMRRILWRLVDGGGDAESLRAVQTGSGFIIPSSFTPGDRDLVFHEPAGATGNDIFLLNLTPKGSIRALVNSAGRDRNAVLSPDGRWLAYESNETGRDEIYVRPFPKTDAARWPVSTGGGLIPTWSHDGQQLFYMTPGSQTRAVLFSVDIGIDGASQLRAGRAREVLNLHPYFLSSARPYDVGPDGRFLMMKLRDNAADRAEFVMVVNWGEELKDLVKPR
jgi:serine/threonine-protein kinase